MKIGLSMLAVCLAVSLILAGCTQQGGSGGNNSGYSGSGSGSGRAVFAATDAAANMQSVSSIQMTVNQVSVHSATEGWTTVSTQPKTFDWLALKGSSSMQLLADANLKAGTYDQMRLDVSNVVVTDAEGQHDAKLPSNQLKLMGDLVVKANQTSTASFDFLADESLHVAGNAQGKGKAEAKYVLTPVVNLETRENAEVQSSGSEKVEISGGSVKTHAKIGMDLSGNMAVGVSIPAEAVVDVSSSGVLTVGNGSGTLGIGIGGDASGSGGGSSETSGSASGDVGVSGSGSGSVAGSVTGGAQGGASGSTSGASSGSASGNTTGSVAGALGS